MPYRLWFLIVLSVLLAAMPARAGDTSQTSATYGLYTGGVRMIDVSAAFDIAPKHYAVRTDARTIGIFETLLPWTGTFETTGGAGFRPTHHDYTVGWRKKPEHATFTYDASGNLTGLTVTKNGKTVENAVDPDIAKNTRDLLSAQMVLFDTFARTGKCTLDVLAFDNARSFLIRYKDAGDITLNNPKLSVYTGPAHGCTVEIVPQKGNWPKKPRGWLRIQAQSKDGGKLPTLWLAKPAPDKPVIPVRVDIHTKYGDVIAHLKALK